MSRVPSSEWPFSEEMVHLRQETGPGQDALELVPADDVPGFG